MKPLWRAYIVVLLLGSTLAAWWWLQWIEKSHEQPFSLVEDGLYIGSSVKQPPQGTQAVVNLCGRKDPYEAEASHWAPVFEGGNEPSVDWLKQAVDFIATQRKAGRQTYVHCLAGMNRSGAVVVAYLMYEHDWSRDEALAFLQSKRDVVQPNPTLMRLLADWETILKKDRTN